MGFLLKVVVFAVAIWGAWSMARRWFRLLTGTTQSPPPVRGQAGPGPTAGTPRAVTIEETRQCPACGAYVSVDAIGRPCPHT